MRSQRFTRIRERLLRGGVAPRHVRRTIEELESHLADIVAELESAGLPRVDCESQASVRLGSDDVIVASVLARPELRSWGRRWPWLAFGLLPVISFATLFVLSMIALLQAFQMAQHFPGWMSETSPSLHWLAGALKVTAIWVTPLLAAGLACVEAARRRAPIAWPLSATIVIGILGAGTTVTVAWPTAPGNGVLSAGLGFSTANIPAMLAHAIASIALVLVPYLWWRRAHQRA